MNCSPTHIILATQDNNDAKIRRRIEHLRSSKKAFHRDAYHRLTRTCEKLVRRILSTELNLSPRRLLSYRKEGQVLFNELDAVLLDDASEPYAFVEIKASINNMASNTLKQLWPTLEVGKQRWNPLSGVGIWIDTSSLHPSKNKRNKSSRPVTELDTLVDLLRPAVIEEKLAFRIDLKELLTVASREGYLSATPAKLCKSAARALRKQRRPRSASYTGRTVYKDPGIEQTTSTFAELLDPNWVAKALRTRD